VRHMYAYESQVRPKPLRLCWVCLCCLGEGAVLGSAVVPGCALAVLVQVLHMPLRLCWVSLYCLVAGAAHASGAVLGVPLLSG